MAGRTQASQPLAKRHTLPITNDADQTNGEGDVLLRPSVFYSRLDPLPALLDGGVGQAHQHEGRQSPAAVDLTFDAFAVQADDGATEHFCEHGVPFGGALGASVA